MAGISREKWAGQREGCMVCSDRTAQEVHHIVRGKDRGKAREVPATWLCLCQKHHDEMGDYSEWPVVRQLALKRWKDRKYYNRYTINGLRDRGAEAISEAEVLRAQHELHCPVAKCTIVGLDMGTKTGVALGNDQVAWDGDSPWSFVSDWGREQNVGDRYTTFRQMLGEAVWGNNPLAIACEAPGGTYQSRDQAASQYGYFAHLLQFAAASHTPLCEYAPKHVKKTLTGDGLADKDWVAKAVSERFALDPPIKAGDEADALAVLATALQDPEVWALVPLGGE